MRTKGTKKTCKDVSPSSTAVPSPVAVSVASPAIQQQEIKEVGEPIETPKPTLATPEQPKKVKKKTESTKKTKGKKPKESKVSVPLFFIFS